jgi:hypothetical protein
MTVPAHRLQVLHFVRAAVRPISPVMNLETECPLATGAPPPRLFESPSGMDLIYLLDEPL